MNTDLTLVIMAAGLGRRFGGDKQLAPLGPAGEPMLVLSIRSAIACGFTRTVIVIRPELEMQFSVVLAYFIPNAKVHFCYQSMMDVPEGCGGLVGLQRTKPWGTAHALWSARHLVSGPMAVINADDFYGEGAFARLAAGLKTSPNEWMMVAYPIALTLSEHGGVNRGVCQVADNRLQSVQEWLNIHWRNNELVGEGPKEMTRLDAHSLVSMTCWGFSPSIFDVIKRELAAFIGQQGPQSQAECYLPAVVQAAIEQGEPVSVSVASEPWLGVTYPKDTVWVKQQLLELLGD
ncbi:nucleotidyltransferase family protein [Shewanella acanthi]|uniref:nucleotidyltransferase family protein n=1 Tax=Shewanella acanthi TaxID=2864212 RepID=UPI001C6563BD|nr:NTP transferase domain-containing protein [Shewanella acanthi]QYJ78574.1 NTP transferase domain-containing protein [Shewanella acanthi]